MPTPSESRTNPVSRKPESSVTLMTTSPAMLMLGTLLATSLAAVGGSKMSS